MAASALFVLDLKGKPLISRSYKGDVGLGDIEPFMGVLLQREEEGTLSPVLRHGPLHFLWIKHNNLYYEDEAEDENKNEDRDEAEAGAEDDEDEAEDDEAEDKDKAEDEVEDDEVEDDEDKDEDEDDEAEAGAEDEAEHEAEDDDEDEAAEPCRPQVSANGSVVLSEVVGTIKLKVFLSGMPELRLGLNDRVLFELTGRGKNKSVELEDVKFHQCVRLSRFDNDRTISFIPPDGDFELMSYRLHTQVKPLIWIESVIEKFSHSRVEIMVKAKGQFKKQSVASGVEISVPVPSDADSPKFKSTVGTARYLPERNVLVWSIKSFPGGKEHLLRAHFGLPSVEKEEEEGRPPIAVRFEIPYFTVSGIQ
ncbi:hypothetical protein HGM15179_019442, partial [Zosterops borbonicus]